MNTHQIIDGNGKSVLLGLGADLFLRADLLSQPGYKLVKVDGSDATPPEAPERTVGPTNGANGQTGYTAPAKVVGTVTDKAAEARILGDRAALRACGLAEPEILYKPGSDMMAGGEEVYFRMEQDYNARPDFDVQARDAIAYVANQHRRDVVVGVDADAYPSVDVQGWLHIGGKTAQMSPEGLGALVRKFPEVFPGAERYLLQTGASALGACMTDAFQRYGAGVKSGAFKARSMQLRIKDGKDGQPVLWAVVGPRYPGRATDADTILGKLVDLLGAGEHMPKGTVAIDPNTSRMVADVAWWNTTIGANPKVGDVFRAFIGMQSRDDGMGAYTGSGGVEAIRCINCTTAQSVAEAARGEHRSVQSVMRAVDATLDARNAIGPMLERWGYVANVDCALVVEEKGEDVTITDRADIVSTIWSNGDLLAECLRDVGIARDAAVEMVLSAWKSEDDQGRMDGSLVDTVRAVAKAAQDRRLDVFQRASMEAASGTLLRILSDGTIEA